MKRKPKPVNRASPPLAALCGSLVAALACLSCTQRNDQGAATSSAAQAVAAPSASGSASGATATRSPKAHPRGGTVALFFRAAEDLDLTSAQHETIAKLEPRLHADDSDRAAGETLRSDLAAGIRAGAIDQAKVAADQAALEKIALADEQARVAALNGLHDALSPSDRKAVTSDVRVSETAREPHRNLPDMDDAGASPWTRRRLQRLTLELDLDPSQQKEVAALLSKDERPESFPHRDAGEAGKRRLDALLDAFDQDAFDAGALFQSTGNAGLAPRTWLDHEVAFLGHLLPILKPAQREKLAASVVRPRGEWRALGEGFGDPADMPSP
jgi:Spy/CpxP family protein refolding chaperone